MISPCPRDHCGGTLLVDQDNRRYCWACSRYADPLPPIASNIDLATQARNLAIYGDPQTVHRGRPRLADVAERLAQGEVRCQRKQEKRRAAKTPQPTLRRVT